MALENPDVDANIANWLLLYRNTVHPTTGVEPNVLMFKRRTRTALSVLHPISTPPRESRKFDHEQQVIEKQSPSRQFGEGDHVLYWDEHRRDWKPGVVSETQGSKVLLIRGEFGETRKHLDQVVKDHRSTRSMLNDSAIPKTSTGLSDRLNVTIGHEQAIDSSVAGKEHEQAGSVKLQLDSDLPSSSSITPAIPVVQDAPTPIPLQVNAEPRRTSTRATRGLPPDRLQYDRLGGGS